MKIVNQKTREIVGGRSGKRIRTRRPGLGIRYLMLSEDTAVNVPMIRASISSLFTKHLTGQHDQKKHGGEDSLLAQYNLPRSSKRGLDSFVEIYGPNNAKRLLDFFSGYKHSSGVTSRIAFIDIFNGDPSMKVQFIKNGKIIGRARREFGGPESVEHSFLILNTEYRGSGLGTDFVGASENAYRKAGIEIIELEATDAVGGYAWAVMGYDFMNDVSNKRVVSGMQDLCKNLGAPIPKDESHAYELAAMVVPYKPEMGEILTKTFNRLESESYTYEGSYRTQTFKYIRRMIREAIPGKPFNLGKAYMLTSSWRAYKDLQNKGQQMVGDKFFASHKKKI